MTPMERLKTLADSGWMYDNETAMPGKELADLRAALALLEEAEKALMTARHK